MSRLTWIQTVCHSGGIPETIFQKVDFEKNQQTANTQSLHSSRQEGNFRELQLRAGLDGYRWLPVTLYMLGFFSCICCHLLTFFKVNFFRIFVQKYYQNVKQFGYESGLTFFPNCLQRLSADGKVIASNVKTL